MLKSHYLPIRWGHFEAALAEVKGRGPRWRGRSDAYLTVAVSCDGLTVMPLRATGILIGHAPQGVEDAAARTL